MIKGYVSICGDIIHPGHVRFLKTCKVLCDWLVVGVMTDDAIEKYKGKKPIMTYGERAEVIKAIKYVDEIVPQNTFEFPFMLLCQIGPDIVFDSTEHKRKVYKLFKGMLVKYTKGISSSIIKERIIASSRNRKR